MIALFMTLFGGIGASTRFVSDGLIRAVLGRKFPWATIVINVAGSLILGLITGLAISHQGLSHIKLVVGMGFCGGFTTFSTACFESIRLFEEKRYGAFWVQLLGNLLLSLSAAMLGVGLAS